MIKMFTLKYVLVFFLVLLCLGNSVLAKEEEEKVRQVDHNRIVLDLPTFNFTRLYNDINLSRLYNRLFNTTKEKEQEDVQDVSPKETMETQRQQLHQPIVTQTIGLPSTGYQYINAPPAITGLYNPNLVSTSFATQRNALSDILSSQSTNGQMNLQLLEGSGRQLGQSYGHGHGPGPIPGYGYAGYGPGYRSGYVIGPSYGYQYPAFSLTNTLLNANRVPYVQVQELAPSSFNDAFYNLYNRQQQYQFNGYHKPSYHGGGGHKFPSRFGQSYEPEGIESYSSYGLEDSDDFYDSYDEENGDDYDEGDDFDDGEGSFRKANADTKLKAKTKQRKTNKRLNKRKGKQQHQQSKQRFKRITY